MFNSETVPAPEKIVSIVEPHTDIIRKDRRDTLYGHKVFRGEPGCFTCARAIRRSSGLIW